MKLTFGRRLDVITRNSLPVLFTLLLVLVNVVPLHIPGFSRIVPVLPLISIYHWAVYRPEVMSPLAVFFIGALHDILSGTPLGVSSFVFLVVYGLVLFQQRFFTGKSFTIIWLGFGLMAFGAAVVSWLLVSALSSVIVEPRAVFFQFILNFGCFPLLAWVLLRWQNAYLKQE